MVKERGQILQELADVRRVLVGVLGEGVGVIFNTHFTEDIRSCIKDGQEVYLLDNVFYVSGSSSV